MTKRLQPKSKAPTPASTGGMSARAPMARGGGRRTVSAVAPTHSNLASTRPTYVEAVAIYEKGIEALQRHDYNHALELLQSVLRQYPEEKELHERVRLYLNICER